MMIGDAAARREPVLSYVYHAYETEGFNYFGGGLLGYMFIHILTPLISIVGIVILTLILLISSGILLLKKRHRDVAKVGLENVKQATSHAYNRYGHHREQRRLQKQEKKSKSDLLKNNLKVNK